MKILVESQYIGTCTYWSALLSADQILIDSHEHFEKRSYRNRAHILGANGLLRLSIPLERGKHQHSAMKDVGISYNENWQKIHWQSFTSAYQRSPFFEFYEDHFRNFFEIKTEKLIDFNTGFVNTIAAVLKKELNIGFTDAYSKSPPEGFADLRNTILPGKNTNALKPYTQVFSDRFEFVQDLCVLDLLFNAGPQSRDYLDAIRS